MNPLFRTFADLVNKVGVRKNADWLMPDSYFSRLVKFAIKRYENTVVDPGFLRDPIPEGESSNLSFGKKLLNLYENELS